MAEKSIEISILITFYNQEEFVDKTIESVINQKFDFPFEIIIGDDGSTDSTFDLINRWTIQYPNLIKSFKLERENKQYIGGFRASQNRLKLLKEVKGEFFIFLDGDDFYIDENKLLKQYYVLKNSNNNDCIACGHNMNILFDNGEKRKTTSLRLTEGKISPKKYWRKYYIHTDALLFRSEIIKYIDYDLVKNNFNDNLITYLAIQYGNIYYLPDVMGVYYQSSNGIWTGNKEIINHIRNMFIYDLCNTINFDFKNETKKRFAYSWYCLFKNRKLLSISSFPIDLYYEALEKNFKYSLMWMNYDCLSLKEKIHLFILFLVHFRLLIVDKIFNK